MLRIRAAVLLCILMIAMSAVAQDAGSERVLLPVWSNDIVSGAFGSLWKTELAIVNRGTDPVQIDGYDYGCTLATCAPTPPTPAGVTFSPILQWVPTGVQGFFLYVARDRSRNVQFELRVRDLSRQQETWGAEVPVVREQDFRTSTFDLLDVPLTTGFRQTLRVYDVDPSLGPSQVRIQVFGTTHRLTPFSTAAQAAPADPLLLDISRDFRYATSGSGVFNYPGYVELTDFGQSAAAFESARVEIQPVTTGHRYWAMVSVTNDATQHVTMITPH